MFLGCSLYEVKAGTFFPSSKKKEWLYLYLFLKQGTFQRSIIYVFRSDWPYYVLSPNWTKKILENLSSLLIGYEKILENLCLFSILIRLKLQVILPVVTYGHIYISIICTQTQQAHPPTHCFCRWVHDVVASWFFKPPAFYIKKND